MPGNWIFSAYTIRSYVQPTAPCAGNHFEPSRFFKIQGHKGTFNMNELYRGVGTYGDRRNCPPLVFHRILKSVTNSFYLNSIIDLVPTKF